MISRIVVAFLLGLIVLAGTGATVGPLPAILATAIAAVKLPVIELDRSRARPWER